MVSPHASLGPDQHHRDRPGALRHRLVAASTGSAPRCRASSSTPAASSPTIPASSRCTTAPSSWAAATSTANWPRRRTKTAWRSSPAWTPTAPPRISTRRIRTGSPRDAAGKPYRAADLYVTCVNSPYYDEYIPAILREIIERSHPEGFTDNSWSGLGRDSICYCANCERKFRERAGKPVPAQTRLGRSGLPRVDPVELRPPAGDLGPEQPHHAERPAGRTACGSA